ncbi:unnamed protein product [Hymenolepis diminuta]|uniref:Uncharacterized protein n=1 Tax=Hymenolepis diminuta TaxID=6216 RepID=A0A564XWV5_HYMDI|nr:unnamed protein product [Hymenolepis diminuta]
MKFPTLPKLVKGIPLALEHSGKCRRLTNRLTSKLGMSAEVVTANQRSIFLLCAFND